MSSTTLTFEGLMQYNQYTAPLYYYDGYRGFDFWDMTLLTKAGIKFEGWQDTGFANALRGHADVFTAASGGNQGFGYGYLYSDNHEAFNLRSAIVASAWDSKQPVYFVSYLADGQKKASIEVTLGQKAVTIDFARYGTDFKNIAELKIFSMPGSAGHQGKTGYQIAMDNIQVHWDGKLPDLFPRRAHPVTSPLHSGFGTPAFTHEAGDHSHTASVAGYHSALDSLDGILDHHAGGLTSVFALPAVEHFGT